MIKELYFWHPSEYLLTSFPPHASRTRELLHTLVFVNRDKIRKSNSDKMKLKKPKKEIPCT